MPVFEALASQTMAETRGRVGRKLVSVWSVDVALGRLAFAMLLSAPCLVLSCRLFSDLFALSVGRAWTSQLKDVDEWTRFNR